MVVRGHGCLDFTAFANIFTRVMDMAERLKEGTLFRQSGHSLLPFDNNAVRSGCELGVVETSVFLVCSCLCFCTDNFVP